MSIFDVLKADADALHPQLVEWRRDFHRHPELGFQEIRTAGIVAEHLHNLGLEVSTGIGKTGVVALIEGTTQGPESAEASKGASLDDAPTVLLRFDMDALPIQEETGLPFQSQTAGVMHACGHDGHTAIGMGVAQVLARHRDQLPGRVKLVFQPAEEGLGGAKAMIEDGVLDDPKPDAAFGLHLWSRLPLNQVIVQAGPLWACADNFFLTIHGEGGHGAVPQETIDATLVASQIVVSWQSIVARNIDPRDTAVISTGTFQSGTATNIISGRAELSGTVRTFSNETRAFVLRRMEEMAANIAAAYGASIEFHYANCVPVTVNDVDKTTFMRQVATQIVGSDQVAQIAPMMVGEDMSEFLDRTPGCFILVGASDPETGWHSPHHSPTFDFDERTLCTGVALLSSAAIAYLREAQL